MFGLRVLKVASKNVILSTKKSASTLVSSIQSQKLAKSSSTTNLFLNQQNNNIQKRLFSNTNESSTETNNKTSEKGKEQSEQIKKRNEEFARLKAKAEQQASEDRAQKIKKNIDEKGPPGNCLFFFFCN